MFKTKNHKLHSNSSRKTASPHVYALADFAYEALKNNSYKSQCCVIRQDIFHANINFSLP